MYRPIVGTLAYVLSPDREKVLLIHRNTRTDDDHFGKYNGLGGKLEPNESIIGCIRRELTEEAGIEATDIRLRGTVSWPGFGSQDWLGFIFLVEKFVGTPKIANPEGTLAWHPLRSLPELPMWEGDRYWLDLVFDDDPRVFHGVMPYVDGKPAAWHYDRVQS